MVLVWRQRVDTEMQHGRKKRKTQLHIRTPVVLERTAKERTSLRLEHEI
jgi:hypothetical protein